MEKRVNKIVSGSFELLSDDLVTRCLEEDLFVAGVYVGETNEYLIMIDFEDKMIGEYKAYCVKAQELYDKFAVIDYWHSV